MVDPSGPFKSWFAAPGAGWRVSHRRLGRRAAFAHLAAEKGAASLAPLPPDQIAAIVDGAGALVILDRVSPPSLAQASRLDVALIERRALGPALAGDLAGSSRLAPLSGPLAAGIAGLIAGAATAPETAGADEDPAGVDAAGDVLAHGLRRLLERALAETRAGVDVDRERLARIGAFIDRHLFSTALTPDLIAGDFAMSRAVLYRLFEPMGGVAAHIREKRLDWAQAQLLRAGATPRNIALIARKAGFSSPRSFARAFRERHGVTPAALRRPSGAAAHDA